MRARWSLGIAWGCAALLTSAMLLRLVPVCRDQLAAPFDLISEGPHMCTVKAIQSGFDIYARESFLDLPFFMTPYTPLAIGRGARLRAQGCEREILAISVTNLYGAYLADHDLYAWLRAKPRSPLRMRDLRL